CSLRSDRNLHTFPTRRSSDLVSTTTLDYQADGAGLLRKIRQHLFVVDANGDGKARRLTSGDFFVSNPVWSPDGTKLAFSTSRSRSEEHTSVLQSQSNLVCRHP